MVNPYLVRALPRLWRDQQTLQLGISPDVAVVVSNLDAAGREILSCLDGQRSEAELQALAGAHGATPEATSAFLAELRSAGVLSDGNPAAGLPRSLPSTQRRQLASELSALTITHMREKTLPPSDGHMGNETQAAAVLAHRLATRVIVHAHGRIGPSIAALLAASGVGTVHIAVDADQTHRVVAPSDACPGGIGVGDEGRPYATAATDAILRAAPATHTRSVPRRHTDLAIIADPRPITGSRAMSYLGKDIPHLTVTLRESAAIIGPLVIPGATACLNCVELHRTDYDPAWPVLAAQLATMNAVESCSVSIAAATAALCATQALRFLDGADPETLGASLELGHTGATIRRRQWDPHPRCTCLTRGAA